MKRLLSGGTGFGPSLLTITYHIMAVPLALYLIVRSAEASRSESVWGFLGLMGLIVITLVFFAGRRWVRQKEQEWAQRQRDYRAAQIHQRLRNDQTTAMFSLYLRPFTSTGHVRIPVRSFVLKRGVLAGPGTIYDPELGRTSLYKRYVRFSDFETELAASVEAHAPLVALGTTGEQIGAGRIRIEEKNWEEAFQLLAIHAAAVFLVPSQHEGTYTEMQRIRSVPALLRKTIFFVPPDDTILGGDVGPHLGIGARAGPVGNSDLRADALAALTGFASTSAVFRLTNDNAGAIFQMRSDGQIYKYSELQILESFSFNPFSVGSNMHLDRDDLRHKLRQLLWTASGCE